MSETTTRPEPHKFVPAEPGTRDAEFGWCAVCGYGASAYVHASQAERAAFDSQREPPPAPGQVPVETVPVETVPAPKRSQRNVIIAVAAGVAVTVGVVLAIGLGAFSSHSAQRGGFYNMTTLENSVQSQIDTDPSMPLGATVLGCSMVSGNTATCQIGEYGSPNDQGITVLISADGSTWTQQ